MDGLDNCCIALIVFGAVVEEISKCFTPGYAKQKESTSTDENNKQVLSNPSKKLFAQKMI